MKRLCTICARGGSKGVINKNIRELLGKPLIAYSILQAKESNLFHTISISSDSDEILRIGEIYGADYLIKRPYYLAEDNSPKLPVIKHAFKATEELSKEQFDIIVDLDATSPLRSIEDIKNVLEIIESKKYSNVITGTPSRRSPYFNMVELDEAGKVKLSKTLTNQIFRRQDSPRCYDLNASIYAWTRESLTNSNTIINENTHLYIMPEERSIDIDSELDFQFVELLMKRRYENHEE